MNETNIVNLTDHAIIFVDADGNTFHTINPSGLTARIDTVETPVDILNNIPIFQQRVGGVINLPEEGQNGNTVYVVSTMVRMAFPNRFDLYSPAQLVRDNQGRVIGCSGLVGNS